MPLEEQIELFTQKLVTKNNLPSWFTRSIKDLISKNVTIEEWNTFTQYISNNASDIKSIEEFILILADYLEECCTKEYVDNKVYGNSISLSGANGTLTDEQLSILTNYKDPVIYYTDSLGVVFTLQLKQKYQNQYIFTLDVSTMVSNYVSVIKYDIKVFTNTKFWVFETSNKNVVTKTYVDTQDDTTLTEAKSYADINFATKAYAQTVADDAANAVKLYFHRVTINFKIVQNVTYTARIYIISKDNEEYTLEKFKTLNYNKIVKIDIPYFIGDNLKTTTYEFRYVDAGYNLYNVIYMQLSNGALTNIETQIEETAITSFNDIIINF